jgi:hypothetical protein
MQIGDLEMDLEEANATIAELKAAAAAGGGGGGGGS